MKPDTRKPYIASDLFVGARLSYTGKQSDEPVTYVILSFYDQGNRLKFKREDSEHIESISVKAMVSWLNSSDAYDYSESLFAVRPHIVNPKTKLSLKELYAET